MNFNAILLSIACKISAKKYIKIVSHNTEKKSTLGGKTDCLFEKLHEEFDELEREQ